MSPTLFAGIRRSTVYFETPGGWCIVVELPSFHNILHLFECYNVASFTFWFGMARPPPSSLRVFLVPKTTFDLEMLTLCKGKNSGEYQCAEDDEKITAVLYTMQWGSYRIVVTTTNGVACLRYIRPTLVHGSRRIAGFPRVLCAKPLQCLHKVALKIRTYEKSRWRQRCSCFDEPIV